jgi:serine phosphatase RsbU (regulator of sigma subunit)
MIKHLPIRTKITLSFLLVALFSLSLVISNNYFGNKVALINSKHAAVTQVEQSILKKEKMFRTMQTNVRSNSFQSISNQDHFNSLISQSNKIEKVSNKIQHFKASEKELEKIDQLKKLNNTNTLWLKEYIIEQKNIGHKSYGLIGTFRKEIHNIEENYSNIISHEQLLKLRRIEKDYLLRKEDQYQILLNQEIDLLREQLINQQETEANTGLKRYQNAFNKVDYSYKELGTDTNGIQGAILNSFNAMNNEIQLLSSQMSQEISTISSEINTFQKYSTITLLTLIVLTIIILSKQIAKPINQLDQTLKRFVASDYKEHANVHLISRKDEIGSLIRNFSQIEKDVVHRFKSFKTISQERQTRLQEQNEKIKIQKFLLNEQKKKLESSNKDHTDSLYYAQKLQKALLPSQKKLEKILGSYGTIFKPKDIVSGDFYWVEENDDFTYFAVGDCTGHGIPGAFLSILCTNFLNSAIHDKGITSPNRILNHVSGKVAKALQQKGFHSEIKDGMDIALCVYDKKKRLFYYSGAQRPLVLLRNNELIEFKADKFPIGWVTDQFHQPFTLHEIHLEKHDKIFLFTDGYVDQFGGEKNKKLKYKKLKELILESCHLSIKEQMVFLNQFMINWQGFNNEQIDDICVMGVEFTSHMENLTPIYQLTPGENQQHQKGYQTINP